MNKINKSVDLADLGLESGRFSGTLFKIVARLIEGGREFPDAVEFAVAYLNRNQC